MTGNFMQKTNPLPLTSGTPFGIGQPSQGQPNTTQQPFTLGAGAPLTGGTGNFAQLGSNTNLFGQTTHSGTVPSFGLPQASAPSSSSLTQPSQPQFGSLPSTGSLGLASSTGGLFGRPSSGPLAFGQPSTSTLQSPSPFGLGGLTQGTSQVQQNPLATQTFAESSKDCVCVHRETLEKLKGVDWTTVSEGALFHELPEAVKAVLIDVSTRLGTEGASLESAKRESAEVKQSLLTLSEIASERSVIGNMELSKRPALSEIVSSTAESVRKTSAASVCEAEELLRANRSFQTLIQRALRGLFDTVSSRKGAATRDTDAPTEDKDFSLMASMIHELEGQTQWVLTQVQSLAIQWPERRERSVWSLRRLVEGLRAVIRGVGERFSACHDSVKGLRDCLSTL